MNSAFVILVHVCPQFKLLLLRLLRRIQTNNWMCFSPHLITVRLQLDLIRLVISLHS